MTNKEAICVCKALWRYEKVDYTDKEVREALDLAIKALEERPHGVWTTVKGIEGTYYCSECDGDIDWKSRYCPWCGADMRGDNNE